MYPQNLRRPPQKTFADPRSAPLWGLTHQSLRTQKTKNIHGTIIPLMFSIPSEKYYIINWDDDIPNIWKNPKCSSHHQPAISSATIFRGVFVLQPSILREFSVWRKIDSDGYPLVNVYITSSKDPPCLFSMGKLTKCGQGHG